MKKLEIIQKILGTQELTESGLVTKWASNFDYQHLVKEEIARWEKYNPTFYIVKAEAEHNYGLDFNIYVSYKADGINFFNQFQFIHSLTSYGVKRVLIFDKEIHFSKETYDKGKENRQALREHSALGWIFG